MAKRRIPVRDDQRCGPRFGRLDALEHGRFALRIKGAGGLIEDQERRSSEERSGQHEPLAFTSGKLAAAVADGLVQTAGESPHSFDKPDRVERAPQLRRLGRIHHPREVAAHAVVEDVPVLADVSEACAPMVERFSGKRFAIDSNAAFCGASRPATISTSVVFPTPEVPEMPSHSPGLS